MNQHVHISDPLIAQVTEIIGEQTGLFFTQKRWPELKRGVVNAAREMGHADLNLFIDELIARPLNRQQIELLASHLTVGETYFFREPRSFEALRDHVLTDLVTGRRGREQFLRVWIAGCATGEEPYSIAILLHELLPDIDNWRVNILATDINPRFLRKAAEGLYSEWSFRGVPERIKQEYFTTTPEGRLRIDPRIQRMVAFSYHNLVEDNYPALANGTNAMDLIICRNVLMYFNSRQVARIIESLHRSLLPGGWLVVSAVETSATLFSRFAAVQLNGLTLYRKTDEPMQLKPEISPAGTLHLEYPFGAFDTPDAVGQAINWQSDSIPPSTGSAPAVIARVDAVAPGGEAYGLYLAGRYDEAAERIAGLLTETPRDVSAIKLLARIRANQGRLTEAQDWCVRAVHLDKLDAGCHFLLATIQQELGLIDDAIVSLKRALYLEPGLVLAYFTLGNLARLRGKAGDQDKYFTNALSLLDQYGPEDMLPESEGLTAMRLREIILSLAKSRAAA